MSRAWRAWLAGALGLAVAGVVWVAFSSSDVSPDTGAAPPPPAVSAVPGDVYDPVAAGEPLPAGYRPLLDRDQIRPIYDPVFTSADLVDWPPDSLVIGVADGESAKAYPVTHLNQRELVVDTLGDIPILVSW